MPQRLKGYQLLLRNQGWVFLESFDSDVGSIYISGKNVVMGLRSLDKIQENVWKSTLASVTIDLIVMLGLGSWDLFRCQE